MPEEETGMPSDADFIYRCRKGDAAAYDALVLRYQALVKLVAWRRMSDNESAEDVAQEAFVRAWKSLDSLDDPARFRPWLLRITANIATDHLRKRKTENLPLEENLVGEQEDRKVNVSDRLEKFELRQRIAAAIDSLPKGYRVPAVLRYIEDISYKEIAERMSLKEEAVRKRLQRANHMLRVKLLPLLKRDGLL